MREDRKLRLEMIMGLLDDLKSPKDSVKKELHEKYFSHIKLRTFMSDFEKLFEFCVLEKFKTKTKWKEEEDELLIKHSKNMTLEDVQKKYLPHRTIHMLNYRSSQLQLNLHQYKTSPWNKHWTKTELYILIQGGELGLSIPEINDRLLDRTEMSIYLKLWKLGYKTKQHKDEDYIQRPWEKWEERMMRKWYPLVGTGESERREIICTPNIRDFLPNRTIRSIHMKSNRMNLHYNPQKGLGRDDKRCVLCLKVKSLTQFSGLKSVSPYCKECNNEIGHIKKYVRRDFEVYEKLGTSLQQRFITEYDDYVSRNVCIQNVSKVILKYGYKCFFEDEYCDNRHLKNLTIDHIIPSSRMTDKYQIIDPNNLLIMCYEHNVLKNDLNLFELKSTIKNMSKKIELFYGS